MKKVIILLLGLIVTACNDDFLDQVPDDRLTFEATFAKRDNVDQYLANIYSRIPNEFAQRYTTTQNSGPWTGASDEAEYVWSFHWGNYLNVGDWNATTGNVSTLWSNFYRGIRSASTFMANVDKCQDCQPERINQYKAEARVLRAYFYYNLVRAWGPVILLGDEPVSADADLSQLNRSTMQECVDYIVSELDMAANSLEGIPFKGQNAGRMSRPFALAIKEKVLLHNASPLFNGNTDYAEMTNEEGTPLISQTTDNSKWQAAANAAKDFIDEYVPGTFSLYRENDNTGSYSPYLSTRNVMLEDWNEEIIYARTRGDNYYHYDVTPLHSNVSDNAVKGAGGLSVTQEMVDAYFMANGKTIDDPTSGYVEDGFSQFQAPFDFTQRSTYNQWVNREPRFYVGITYNRSLWLNTTSVGNIITETWYNGNSGKAAGGNDYPPTGYIARKKMITGPRTNNNRTLPMMRLAEIYLDYAEALNEADPGNPDILIYLNKIRERAGIPIYGDAGMPVPSSQSAMREAIHRERRVELAFENIRYFDVIRWKKGPQLFDGPKHGLDINAPEESNFYNVVEFEQRVFSQRHSLFPIPQDEINANPELIQNTGW
ncbi:MAG: RagB/SusD family nutrient uptake outer membrane protein [Zunongwangia sp.]|uniref:RagB/SusD family nutrient uptake outer membrane protein n=1 Tax=Zunongwangia TaxID=417127 RepID=UPI000C37C473|nr:RagB/SusD family nutrient uptake outer membrane protein [Zunongwangia profunda]MAB91461.1 RagB/SusD family nutrient uptake outer membrane protein [Planctomycetota bacterium]MAO37880.1 RagB/SusD family nutrient uptake outer membrane protein [Zunongwangia sp.]MAS71771.1 RagB/SusD family nutrient uptake outer membrane protein [Zunongwangia sp.]|tara:strand:- start:5657 stop:7456 length:1800 start_codon:yes stop_codon:yes gene_type:complete